jgi:hypothetical protein
VRIGRSGSRFVDVHAHDERDHGRGERLAGPPQQRSTDSGSGRRGRSGARLAMTVSYTSTGLKPGIARPPMMYEGVPRHAGSGAVWPRCPRGPSSL